MPLVKRPIQQKSVTTKGIVNKFHTLYVKKAADGDIVVDPTPKQLAELAELYPKEYDAELGYIGATKSTTRKTAAKKDDEAEE